MTATASSVLAEGAPTHLAEGMLSLNRAVAWSALTAPAVVWSLHHCPLGQTRRVC